MKGLRFGAFFESGQQSSLLSIYTIAYFKTTPMFPLQRKSRQKVAIPKFWGSKSDEGWRFGLFKTISPFLQFVPSWQRTYPFQGTFQDVFFSPKVGYVTFLEGISLKQLKSDNIELLNPAFFWERIVPKYNVSFHSQVLVIFSEKKSHFTHKIIHEKKVPPNDLYDLGIFDMLSLPP